MCSKANVLVPLVTEICFLCHSPECLVVGEEYSCNCSTGYAWSNEVCYNYGCCTEAPCLKNVSQATFICVEKFNGKGPPMSFWQLLKIGQLPRRSKRFEPCYLLHILWFCIKTFFFLIFVICWKLSSMDPYSWLRGPGLLRKPPRYASLLSQKRFVRHSAKC